EVTPVIQAILADLVVQSEPEAVEREIGRERLSARRQGDAARVELGIEVFKPTAPPRRQGDLDTGPGGPARSPHPDTLVHRSGRGRPADRRSGELRAGELVIAEGEAAGRIDQPVAGSVAEAPANAAEELYQLGKVRHASRSGHECLAALDPVGEGDVSLGPH